MSICFICALMINSLLNNVIIITQSMDDLTNTLRGLNDEQDWLYPNTDQIIVRTSAGRNHLSKLFDNLQYYNREGRRIRNQSKDQQRPQPSSKITTTPPPKAMAKQGRPTKTSQAARRKFLSLAENSEAGFAAATSSKRKIKILAPIEFEYSMSLERTRQKSKDLLDSQMFTPRPQRLLSSQRRRFKSREEPRSRKQPKAERTKKTGLDFLCAQTVKAMLFPAATQKSSSPMTKLRRKECQESLLKRLELLKSCYGQNYQ